MNINTSRFQKPQNVILVDWGNGSGFPYNQATANTRVVGEEIAALITSLNRMFGTTNSKYHLIGHSLGAHIAGYAGSRLPELGRITGILYIQCTCSYEYVKPKQYVYYLSQITEVY